MLNKILNGVPLTVSKKYLKSNLSNIINFFVKFIILEYLYMPGKKKNVYRRRRAPLRKRAAGKRKSSVSVGVKKYVNRMIHTNIENKCIQVQQSYGFGTYLESQDFNAFPMCPQTGYWGLGQAAGQGARLGNTIKPRRVILSYVLRPLPYDVNTNPNPVPIEVQLLLGYVKNTPSYVPIGGDVAQLFQSGSSTQAPFSNLRDIIAPINKDYWTIKKRWTHKIGYAAVTGTGGTAGSQYNQNNDFKMNAKRTIDITKMIPSTLKFNDATLGTSSKNLYFMFYAVAATGATVGANFLMASIDYWLDFEFEDA